MCTNISAIHLQSNCTSFMIKGFPDSSVGKESACNVGDLDSIPGLGRSPGEGKRYPLQYSGLENSMNCIVHGVTKSQTQLSDFQFTYRYYTYLYTRCIKYTYLYTICIYINYSIHVSIYIYMSVQIP